MESIVYLPFNCVIWNFVHRCLKVFRYRSFTCLVKFIPMNFILFEATVNKVVFFISLPDSLLLMYTNCLIGFAKETNIVCKVAYWSICPISKFRLNVIKRDKQKGRRTESRIIYFTILTLLSPRPFPIKWFLFTYIFFTVAVRANRSHVFTNFIFLAKGIQCKLANL